MITYSGLKESIKKVGITYICTVLCATATFLWVPSTGVKILILFILLPVLHLTYQGLILKVTLDETEVKVYRLLDVQRIPIKDIAFCAVHGIDDNRFLIYCFIRKGKLGKDGVRGIREKFTFDEVVQILAKDDGQGSTGLDINFNMAKKIPASFVENSEDLKQRLLLAVDQSHAPLLKNMNNELDIQYQN